MLVVKASVVGAGTMGAEIAAVIAAAGIPVVLSDVDSRTRRRRARAGAGDRATPLDALVASGKLERRQTPPRSSTQARARLRGTVGFEGLGDVDLVIEAVPEQLGLKLGVFARLDAATPGQAILASNTSSLSISELAAATSRPERVLGLHFFNPASVMRLVEVVEGDETSSEALAGALAFVAALRRTAIRCADAPGFIVNRVLGAAVGELWRVQEERGLAPAAVDAAITTAGVAPMGPFALADMLGLDTVLTVAEALRDAYGNRFHVHEPMRELVARGELGAKSGGVGFYRGRASRARATPSPTASSTRPSWASASPSRRSSRPASCSRRASRERRTSTSR